jgi:hypothetical protein
VGCAGASDNSVRFWQDIGAGENFITQFLRFLFLLAAAAVFFFIAALPLSWEQQAVPGLVTLAAALAMAQLRAVPDCHPWLVIHP